MPKILEEHVNKPARAETKKVLRVVTIRTTHEGKCCNLLCGGFQFKSCQYFLTTKGKARQLRSVWFDKDWRILCCQACKEAPALPSGKWEA